MEGGVRRSQSMLYEFKCPKGHGSFEVEQDMLADHKADCPKCQLPAQRIFPRLEVIWSGSIYRPDSSLRQDEDYAEVMGG